MEGHQAPIYDTLTKVIEYEISFIQYVVKLALPLLLSLFCHVAQLTLPNCQVHIAKYFSLVDYPNLNNFFGLSSLLFRFFFLIGCLFPTPFLFVLSLFCCCLGSSSLRRTLSKFKLSFKLAKLDWHVLNLIGMC